jgi:hypothetical protein
MYDIYSLDSTTREVFLFMCGRILSTSRKKSQLRNNNVNREKSHFLLKNDSGLNVDNKMRGLAEHFQWKHMFSSIRRNFLCQKNRKRVWMENSNKWIFHYFSKLNQIFSFLLNLQ